MLMKDRPPFGMMFQKMTAADVRRMQENATLPAKQEFGSCAVVGNSGTLRLQRLGAEIDAHDAVFRVNHAPVPTLSEGQVFIPFAGRKTTWRVVTSLWFKERKKDPSARLLVLCDRPFIYSCHNYLFETGRIPRAHLVNPRFYAAVRERVGRSKIPLAGVVTAAIALRSCESVDVYGLSIMEYPDAPPRSDGGRAKGRAAVEPAAAGSGAGGARVRPAYGPRVCDYYYRSGARCPTDSFYHTGRPGDAEFHDFRAHARALLRWNTSGLIRIRVR